MTKLFGLEQDTVNRIRELYPKGTKIRLIEMNDKYSTLKEGDEGTVAFVDDIGTVHMKWQNGSSLGLIYGEDKFVRI